MGQDAETNPALVGFARQVLSRAVTEATKGRVPELNSWLDRHGESVYGFRYHGTDDKARADLAYSDHHFAAFTRVERTRRGEILVCEAIEPDAGETVGFYVPIHRGRMHFKATGRPTRLDDDPVFPDTSRARYADFDFQDLEDLVVGEIQRSDRKLRDVDVWRVIVLPRHRQTLRLYSPTHQRVHVPDGDRANRLREYARAWQERHDACLIGGHWLEEHTASCQIRVHDLESGTAVAYERPLRSGRLGRLDGRRHPPDRSRILAR